jgi:23S rRNA pseudouridine2605 synthase
MTMDDKDNKPPRASKAGGKRFAAGKGGKSTYGGKPGKARPASGADRSQAGERKPFRRREDRNAEPDNRPRPFRKAGAISGDAGPRPFGKGPRKHDGDDKRRGAPRPGRAERETRRVEEETGKYTRPETEGRPPRDRKPFAKPFRGAGESRGEPKRFVPGAPKARPGEREREAALRNPDAAQATGERIAKRLARAGIASRRDAEELIAAGRVKVNGRVIATPAFNVKPGDVIHLDDTEIPAIERTRLFLFHKPAGVVTTSRDPEGRRTVFDVLPAGLPRLMSVGRLDINTEGLLLLTNDGGLSRVLELPATGWLRRYRVRVHGKVDEKALAGLKDGIAVDGVFYGSVEASLERTQGTNAWLTVGLREGKNREVKNIMSALGLEVTRLIRVSYGPFQLGELPEGHVLEIKGRTLREQLGERLIEESGANFEADVLTPFSNRPVRRAEPAVERPPGAGPKRDGSRPPIGEGGLIKARKRRENSRDEALGKLSTRPERSEFQKKQGRGGKAGGDFSGRPERGAKKFNREDRPVEAPGHRRANVWMAPGARPMGKKSAASQDTAPDHTRKRDRQGQDHKSGARSPRQGSKPGRPGAESGSATPRGGGRGKPPKKH